MDTNLAKKRMFELRDDVGSWGQVARLLSANKGACYRFCHDHSEPSVMRSLRVLGLDLSRPFSTQLAERRRDMGISLAGDARRRVLQIARRLASQIAMSRSSRTVNADDVMRALIREGYHPSDLGNAAGAIFTKGNWRRKGFVRSTRTSNNRRVISQWELV